MKKSNNLTSKEFWNTGWKSISIPARYSYDNYSNIVISDLFKKYISRHYKTFLEIGGCPGRWADYFFNVFGMECDSMDYTFENLEVIKKNYKVLGIKGDAIFGDITRSEVWVEKKYDIVLSDGLIEHFINSDDVFRNHIRYLKEGGLLVVGVPNIKKSWFYNFFSKFDMKSYRGYRHIDRQELIKYAKDNGMEILYCSYAGVFNFGLINTERSSWFFKKITTLIYLLSSKFLKITGIKKESSIFSPYIYLIARK